MMRSGSTARIALLAPLACAVFNAIAAAQSVSAPLQAPNTRKPAPSFRLMNSSGKPISLAGYRGQIVLLNFWATECGGCRLELPWFVQLDKEYKDKGVAVVGVSMDISYEELKDAKEAWNKVNPFVHTHDIDYAILMGDDEVSKRYSLDALPATYLVDQSGRVAATYVGLISKSNVETNVNALLAEHRSGH